LPINLLKLYRIRKAAHAEALAASTIPATPRSSMSVACVPSGHISRASEPRTPPVSQPPAKRDRAGLLKTVSARRFLRQFFYFPSFKCFRGRRSCRRRTRWQEIARFQALAKPTPKWHDKPVLGTGSNA
jgi:hypothetical protein